MGITLSTITGKPVTIESVTVDMTTRDAFTAELTGQVVQVAADFIEGAAGQHSYVLAEDPAKQISALMMAQEEGDLTEMAISALTEGFNQMSGAAVTAINDKLGMSISTGEVRASLFEGPGDAMIPEGSFVRIRYNVQTEGKTSSLDEIMDEAVARSLSGGGGAPAVSEPETPPAAFEPGIQQQDIFSTQPAGNVGVQSVQFAPLSQAEQPGVSGNIGLLMDVSMQLTVELGRTKMLIKDILGMGEGTIVELDKLAGEPVDLLVNGKLIAKGEVVVIDENFGVRVTDIISPMERISNLE
jgi:flagellar motor switch protein FliN/FliY